MTELSDWALTNLVSFGVPLLLLVSYVGSLGIPFPISLVIIAAGAFAREGVLNGWLVVPACLIGAALADNTEYILGRLARRWLKRHFGKKLVWLQANSTINRQGGWAILLTRFWLTPLAPAINVIAGSRYPFVRFLFFDIIGQLLWVLLYAGLGYLFDAQWKMVSQTLGNLSWLSVALTVLIGVIYFYVQWRRKQKRIPQEN
jgi:membrane-associated protein